MHRPEPALSALQPAVPPMADGPAPGRPGMAPAWASSDKDAVGTALGASRIWFTVGHGIVNEVYWPHVDRPQLRDLGFVVADRDGFWVEVKRLSDRRVTTARPGVPAVTSEFRHPLFRLVLRICTDVVRDALLLEATLDASDGGNMWLYPLLAPHLGQTGNDNSARVVDGPLGSALAAELPPYALALVADPAPERASVGFVGASDGWQDFAANGRMTNSHRHADGGNVAGMLEMRAGERPLRMALGFGEQSAQALVAAGAALQEPFEVHWRRFTAGWRRAQSHLRPPPLSPQLEAVYRSSMAVIRAHEDATTPGAIIASLSIPWGDAGDDPGGYHLVWSRDLVEAAGGLLAAGDVEGGARVFAYLAASQLPDGSWSQNQWINGTAYWSGAQLDETAFPVLLAAQLREAGALEASGHRPPLLDRELVTSVVRRALVYLVRTGPATSQDRWEEDGGLAPSTLAPVIAALVAGAAFLDEPESRSVLEIADDWNASIERWTYAAGTPLARRLGLAGTYLRVTSAAVLAGAELETPVAVRNRAAPGDLVPATAMISPDVLALVRFGLRSAHDPRIVDTVAAVDATLRTDTPAGPVWHRYTGDGYGETAAGEPFRGAGVGRGWPLLTGERGHYAVAAGEDAAPYLAAMSAMASGIGLLPEQVWDAAPIPERGLLPGRASGSARPLVWAHAEFLKLCHSAAAGVSVDRPPDVLERWRERPPAVARRAWRLAAPTPSIPRGMALRIELLEPALVHLSTDGWATVRDLVAADAGIGLWTVDLRAEELADTDAVVFTLRWVQPVRWEGRNFRVQVEPTGTSTT